MADEEMSALKPEATAEFNKEASTNSDVSFT